MFFMEIGSLLLILLNQNIIQCQANRGYGDDLFFPNTHIQDHDSQKPFGGIFSPLKDTDLTDLHKKIHDDMNHMREKFEKEFQKDFSQLAGSTYKHELPPLLPPLPPVEEEHTSKKTQSSKPVEINSTETKSPHNELTENNDSVDRLLHSLRTILDPNSESENNKFDLVAPLDIEKIFSDFKDLQSPNALENEEPLIFVQVSGKDDGPDVKDFMNWNEDEDSSSGNFPLQGIRFTVVDSPIVGNDDTNHPNIESFDFKKFMQEYIQMMKNVMDMFPTTSTERPSTKEEKSGSSQNINVQIEDHGYIYEIPPNAYINREIPNMVNITWNSWHKDINNSLCLNVSKDAEGRTVFHHVILRLLRAKGVQEYKLNEPVYLQDSDGENTVLKLGGGVALNFPKPESMDVAIFNQKEDIPRDWLVMAIAVLGLIFAGFVMLLSYAIYMRNKESIRKTSISKEPLA
ncbi:hypothetical protein HHI36_011646 [Cryptolaemus montrouzieri]|uniref:Uncharacterized protein n=1 Tax=Cryptolaemus montrouzieri TaxID=559131 RepID=A0ABD2MME1_9CUCU